MLKLLIALALGLLVLNFSSWNSQIFASSSDVLGASIGPSPNPVLDATQPIHTTSRFETKSETVTTSIPFKTITKDDPDLEIDNDQTTQTGVNGKKTQTFKVTYFEGQEFERELVSTDIVPATDQLVSKGTKIVWRTIDTADGQITYWRKLHVWATQYDSHCPGCNQWTAIGMQQGKGVIAVDPSVIKMRSQVYIPGYGKAVAGDTGGDIKGNRIDVGFTDAHTSGWYSHYVDIYLL